MLEKNENTGIMMPKYMVHFWGIVVSPILALVFMAINLRKLGRKDGVRVVYGAALLYAILVTSMILYLPYESIMFGWLISIIFTVIFVEWTWKRYVLLRDEI